MKSYFDALSRYFDLGGRSTRSQYWLFLLWVLILGTIAVIVNDVAFDVPVASEELGWVLVIFLLVHVIPWLSLSVRRLHDIGWSGWWILLGLVPLVGVIGQLVIGFIPSKLESNRFGSPVGAEAQPPGNPYAMPPAPQQPPVQSPGHYQGPPAQEAYIAAPPQQHHQAYAPVQSPSAPTAPNQSGDPLLDKLERLATLHATGAIDADEYRHLKARLIAPQGRAGQEA